MPSPVDPGDESPLRPPETDHGLGRWLLASGAPRRFVERVGAKGRVVTTSSLGS